MTTLYQEIAHHLRAAGYQGWIDIDKGQLQAPQLFDTITPCVLIEVPDTNWSELLSRHQTGESTLIVKWVFQLPSRTYAHDPLLSQSVEVLKYADTIHEAILHHPNVLKRSRSRRYPAPQLAPNTYVVEQTYAVQEFYERTLCNTPTPPPTITTTIILPSRANQPNPQ